jgi:hypothetical protein
MFIVKFAGHECSSYIILMSHLHHLCEEIVEASVIFHVPQNLNELL